MFAREKNWHLEVSKPLNKKIIIYFPSLIKNFMLFWLQISKQLYFHRIYSLILDFEIVDVITDAPQVPPAFTILLSVSVHYAYTMFFG